MYSIYLYTYCTALIAIPTATGVICSRFDWDFMMRILTNFRGNDLRHRLPRHKNLLGNHQPVALITKWCFLLGSSPRWGCFMYSSCWVISNRTCVDFFRSKWTIWRSGWIEISQKTDVWNPLPLSNQSVESEVYQFSRGVNICKGTGWYRYTHANWTGLWRAVSFTMLKPVGTVSVQLPPLCKSQQCSFQHQVIGWISEHKQVMS